MSNETLVRQDGRRRVESAEGVMAPAWRGRPGASILVMAAAAKLFSSRGVRSVSIQDVVDEAGVTKPSLYRAFPSKDALAAAWLENDERHFQARLNAVLERHAGDVRAGMAAFFEDTVKGQADPEARCWAATRISLEFPDPQEPLHQAAQAYRARFRTRLGELTGDLDLPDADRAADWLLLAFEGVCVSGAAMVGQGLGRSARAAVAQILSGAPLKSAAGRPEPI